MAQHTVAPADFGEHKSPAGAAPAWEASAAHDEKGQHDSSEYPVPSAPNADDLPPSYYDISIVPDNVVLHYNEVTPYTEPSAAVVERKKDGVLSFDSLLDGNPDQLWLYFMTYLNEKPSLVMNIHGYHVERYIDYEQYRDANGNYQTRMVQRTRNITDFNFSIDASNYVSQQWWRVAVMPSKKSQKAGEMITLRDALEQYTLSQKSIKEIVCQKQLVGWNFQELRDKIISVIYSTGYRSHISVSFSVDNNRIAARASSKMSRFSNSTVVRVLCVISCMFLIFGPIYLCLRAAGSTKDRIIADYSMGAPVDTFLYHNSRTIANAALARSRERYMAYYA